MARGQRKTKNSQQAELVSPKKSTKQRAAKPDLKVHSDDPDNKSKQKKKKVGNETQVIEKTIVTRENGRKCPIHNS